MGHLRRKAMLVGVVAVPLVALLVLLVAPIESSRAAPTFQVIDPEDAPDAQLNGMCASTHLGLCTLRAAIQEAEFAGGGIVVLSAGIGDYRLTIPAGAEATGPPSNATGDLDISTNVTVNGVSPDVSVIDGTGTHRIFDVHAGGTLTLNGVTLQNGKGPDYDDATSHEHGGAIHNHGEVRLDHVVVANNSTTGPAWGGGGITNGGNGVAQLTNVTIARNTTEVQGGGIENLGGVLRTLDVTIAENSAPAGKGGGIFFTGSTSMITFATLVAKNTAGGDCANAPVATSTGANLAGDGSCGFTHATDRSGDPGFDTSAFGPPLFYPLLATSQAVDTTNLCFLNIDIRGVSRPQDGNGDGVALCDTGSYERATPAAATCNGQTATIYINALGIIVGGPLNGRKYRGNLNGAAGNDVIVGTSGRDMIAARGGNDVICAGDGNDEIEAGPGNDTMSGGPGADVFIGGAGTDTATDFSSAEGDRKKGVEQT